MFLNTMIYSTRKYVFLLNLLVGILIITFVSLRLYNSGFINLNLSRKPKAKKNPLAMKVYTTQATPFKIPWRFHIEEDGFVFQHTDGKERFVTYERLNGSWTKQILQFENANIFAHLLKRTLLVPPLFPHRSADANSQSSNDTLENDADTFFMSQVIDFDLLSSMVKIGEINSQQTDKIKLMKRYNVCQDPRLGFWLDYIPSVENIQTWRLLKEQYFSPLKLNLKSADETRYDCAGTENYIDRWGPPLRVKPLYRGILTELHKRTEELIYFQGDTLDTKHIRFFNKQRTKKAQELLLFYIRFSKTVTKQTKQLARFLGPGYTAVLANRLNSNNDGVPMYVYDEVLRLNGINNTTQQNIFIVASKTKRYLFKRLEDGGFTLVFADTFIEANMAENEKSFLADKVHLLSLLLCAYATHFIGLPGTTDLYFVEHLRLQDTKMLDGLVTDKVSVKWAKHTTQDKADERKVLLRTTSKVTTGKKTGVPPQMLTNSKVYPIESSSSQKVQMKGKQLLVAKRNFVQKPKKKLDRLNSLACIFCNYIRYVTGKHGCPSMKHIC